MQTFWYPSAKIDLAVEFARWNGSLGRNVLVSAHPTWGGVNITVWP